MSDLGPYQVPGVYCSEVLEGLRQLPNDSVHCVVTSPPYWGLRDYGVEGQIGLEETWQEHLDVMIQVFEEVRRVLRSDGVAWVNYGDSYSTKTWGRNPGSGRFGRKSERVAAPKSQPNRMPQTGLKRGDLVGMPWRFALALQEAGWWLRSDVIWHKPSVIPESVKTRPTKSHEHLFLFAKSARYFYDVDGFREPVSQESVRRYRRAAPRTDTQRDFPGPPRHYLETWSGVTVNGRQARDVWTIATEHRPEAHFATFPRALVERCVRLGTSQHGVCSECGAPWKRQVEVVDHAGVLGQDWRRRTDAPGYHDDLARGARGSAPSECAPQRTTVGWEPTCKCGGSEVEPAIVLDPFVGSGTTAVVAWSLGRDYLGFDLSEEYLAIARKRIGTEARCQYELGVA